MVKKGTPFPLLKLKDRKTRWGECSVHIFISLCTTQLPWFFCGKKTFLNLALRNKLACLPPCAAYKLVRQQFSSPLFFSLSYFKILYTVIHYCTGPPGEITKIPHNGVVINSLFHILCYKHWVLPALQSTDVYVIKDD